MKRRSPAPAAVVMAVPSIAAALAAAPQAPEPAPGDPEPTSQAPGPEPEPPENAPEAPPAPSPAAKVEMVDVVQNTIEAGPGGTFEPGAPRRMRADDPRIAAGYVSVVGV